MRMSQILKNWIILRSDWQWLKSAQVSFIHFNRHEIQVTISTYPQSQWLEVFESRFACKKESNPSQRQLRSSEFTIPNHIELKRVKSKSGQRKLNSIQFTIPRLIELKRLRPARLTEFKSKYNSKWKSISNTSHYNSILLKSLFHDFTSCWTHLEKRFQWHFENIKILYHQCVLELTRSVRVYPHLARPYHTKENTDILLFIDIDRTSAYWKEFDQINNEMS